MPSLTKNLSMHFLSAAGVDGADTVQKIELLEAKAGAGALMGANFKCEKSLSNTFMSAEKLVGGVSGDDGMGERGGEGKLCRRSGLVCDEGVKSAIGAGTGGVK